MKRIDFAAINAALNPETVVPQWLPRGHRVNDEWVAPNPTRADRTPGSFSINLRTGVWKDFAGGEQDWGKDLVSLYAYLFHDNDQGAAARALAENMGVNLDPAARKRIVEERERNVRDIEDAKPKIVLPVPDGTPRATFRHHMFGDPSAIWEYRNREGKLLLYVCRFDPPNIKKQVVPRSWCKHPATTKKPEHSRWTWRGITGKDKRPLYRLDVLAAHPDRDAVVVEGEKTADAAQEFFGESAIVTTWLGGSPTAEFADVRALAGRRVILWPDFDAQREKLTREEADAGVDPASKPLLPFHRQPGIVAMMTLAQKLKGVAREVILVGYDIDPENSGWDLADAKEEGWDTARVMAYMGRRAGDPWHIASGKPAEPAAQPDAPAPANDNGECIPLDAAVNPFGYPHLSDKGQPLNTWENVEYLLQQYGITARYNQVRKAVEVLLPGRSYTADNRANCSLAELTSLCARNRMPQSNLQDYVKLIADRNAYSPVRDWITSKPWDGVTRIDAMCDTVQSSMDPHLKRQLMYRWLLSAVAAVFKPHGFASHGALVFVGSQGQGKTSWVKRLAPPELHVVLEGATIDPTDKDSVTLAISHWLVEIGELDATFRKADIARLKSFITLDSDKLRRPYDRVESEYQRRTVFFASVNESHYLVDDTGNRRWWTIPVKSVDYMHDIDVQQMWAELLVHYERGEQWWLTREEQEALNKLNEEHEATDPIMERIITAFDWTNPGIADTEMTATDVLIAAGFDKPTNSQARQASNALRKLTGKEPVHKAKGRFFMVPRRLTRATAGYPHYDEGRPF